MALLGGLRGVDAGATFKGYTRGQHRSSELEASKSLLGGGCTKLRARCAAALVQP